MFYLSYFALNKPVINASDDGSFAGVRIFNFIGSVNGNLANLRTGFR